MTQTINGNYVSIGSIGNKTIGTVGDLLSVSTHGWWHYPYVTGDQELKNLLSSTKKIYNFSSSRNTSETLISSIIRDDVNLQSSLK